MKKDQEKRKLVERLNAISKKEHDEMVKANYPAFKAKVGTFYKTKNSYGAKDGSWYMYTKITNIKPEYVYDTHGNGITCYFDGFSFQLIPDGTVSIKQEKQYWIHSLEKEISESEFVAAWNKTMDKINSL